MNKKILVVVLSVFMLFSLTGCFIKKTPLTTDDFIKNANSYNFTTSDITNQFTDEENVSKVTIALHDKGYKIEFYELSNKDIAKNMYNTDKLSFDSLKEGKYTETSLNIGNYDTYSLSTESEYMYISRVDKTYLYLRVDISHKDEVKEFIDKIGY